MFADSATNFGSNVNNTDSLPGLIEPLGNSILLKFSFKNLRGDTAAVSVDNNVQSAVVIVSSLVIGIFVAQTLSDLITNADIAHLGKSISIDS